MLSKNPTLAACLRDNLCLCCRELCMGQAEISLPWAVSVGGRAVSLETARKVVVTVAALFFLISFWQDPAGSADSTTAGEYMPRRVGPIWARRGARPCCFSMAEKSTHARLAADMARATLNGYGRTSTRTLRGSTARRNTSMPWG